MHIRIIRKWIYTNKIRFSQAMSSGWNGKKKVYARERQHDKTYKVSELLDQNINTLFYLHHNLKDINSRSGG
jgi:uncharacterized protein YllA (UPF0747 family)